MRDLKHIRRPPLPWRESHLTECGRPVAHLPDVVEWDDARRLAREYGQHRFAMVFCMICTSTTQRWSTWESDPLDRLFRERRGDEEQIQRELRVIAALVAAHRDEFDEAMAGLDAVGDLQRYRLGRRQAPE